MMAESTKAKYCVGVIGCGLAGAIRARAFNLHPSCEVAAIADTDPENLELGCGRFGVPGYHSYEEMFKHERIDVAMPVLPVRPNADAVVAAAQAGVKAIFCEKPLTARLSDADRMVEACRTRNIPFAAGVMVSCNPDYQKAYGLVASGAIGEVRRINLYESNGQGGCHGLNLPRKFADNSPVEHVIGWVEGDPHSDHEEPYDEIPRGFGGIGGYIRFANGIECYSSYCEVGWRGIEVIGTQGMLYNRQNSALGLHLLRANEGDDPQQFSDLREVPGLFQVNQEGPREYDAEGWRDPGPNMRAIVQDLVDAVKTGVELSVPTGDDLRHALEIGIALRESHRRGHAAVQLPLEDRGLVMYPEKVRWYYKKELYGREWYMKQMAQQVRSQ